MSRMVDAALILSSVLIGLLAGFLSGLVGIGGGVVLVPLFRMLLKLPAHTAVGTSLALVFLTSLSGARIYYEKGFVKRRAAVVLAAFGAVFSVLGAFLTSEVTESQLMLLFSAFLLLTSVSFYFLKKPLPILGKDKLKEKGLLRFTGIGSFSGLLAGFFGIGGGSLIVPLLVLVAALPVHNAVATSLAAMALYAFPPALIHAFQGNLDVQLMLSAGVGSVVGSRLGSRKALRLSNEKLRLAVSSCLFLLGLILALHELFFN